MEKTDSPPVGAPLGRRRLLVLLVMVGVVLACITLFSRGEAHLNRVLLLCEVDGLDDPSAGLSGRMVMEVGHRLQSLGFEVATASHPVVAAALAKSPADLDGAQAAVKARWRVEVTARFEETQTDVPGDYRELRGDGQVRWRADRGQTGSRSFAAWGGSRRAAVTRAELVSGAMAHRATAFITEDLVADESVAVTGGGQLAAVLEPARTAVTAAQARRAALDDAATELATGRTAADEGPHKVTYLDPFDARRRICDVSPLGVLVWERPAEGAAQKTLMEAERAQRLVWRKGADEGATVWTGPRLHGPATASADGQTVAFSEVVYNWARTLTVVDGGGLRRLATVSTATFTALALSPSGDLLAAFHQACAKCARRLVVYRTRDGAQVLDLANEGGTFGGFDWASDQGLLVLHTPAKATVSQRPGVQLFPGVEQSLWLISPAAPKQAPKRIFTDPRGRRFVEVESNPERAVLVPGSGAGRGLHVVTLSDGGHALIRTPHRATAPRLSRDGRALTFTLHFGGDTEVGLVSLDGGETMILTQNGAYDRSPVFSPDDKLLIYEAATQSDPLGEVSSLATVARLTPPKSP